MAIQPLNEDLKWRKSIHSLDNCKIWTLCKVRRSLLIPLSSWNPPFQLVCPKLLFKDKSSVSRCVTNYVFCHLKVDRLCGYIHMLWKTSLTVLDSDSRSLLYMLEISDRKEGREVDCSLDSKREGLHSRQRKKRQQSLARLCERKRIKTAPPYSFASVTLMMQVITWVWQDFCL